MSDHGRCQAHTRDWHSISMKNVMKPLVSVVKISAAKRRGVYKPDLGPVQDKQQVDSRATAQNLEYTSSPPAANSISAQRVHYGL
mmetsp:Transcript_39313/g.81901  ORF Transcript_39313/g.81901 Transcript_39313/m.81901 type:complete len:85 (+) Transcript_39313:9-263(+)